MVASGKGGVGKSTLCAHVAAGLARRGKRVLILETDTGFRGLDLLLGLPARSIFDLSDVLEGRCSLEDALQVHEPTGLRVLLAPGDPEYLPARERMAALFSWAGSRWDYVFADCGAGYGPLDGITARLCSGALLITLPDEISARGAAKVSGFLWKAGLTRQRLIINRVPRRLVPSPRVRDLDDVVDLAGVQLLGAVPEAPGLGPPAERAPDTPAGRELDAIARRPLGARVPLARWP